MISDQFSAWLRRIPSLGAVRASHRRASAKNRSAPQRRPQLATPHSPLATILAAGLALAAFSSAPAQAQTAPTFGTDTIADQTYTIVMMAAPLTFPAATGGRGTLTYTLEANSNTPLPVGLDFNTATATTPSTLVKSRYGISTVNSYVNAVFTYTATDMDGMSAFLTFRITVPGGPTFGDQTLGDLTYARGQAITPLTLPQALPSPENLGYEAKAGDTTSLVDVFGLTLTSSATSGNLRDPVVLSGAILESVSLGRQYIRYIVHDTGVRGTGVGLASRFDINFVVVDISSPFFPEPVVDQFYTTGAAIGDLVLSDASGGTTPYTFRLDGAPAGLEFAADTRTLSGMPTAAGTSTLRYTVRDANGMEASRNFAVTVAAPPSFGSATVPDQVYTQNVPITDPLTFPVATGGSGRITYSLKTNSNARLAAGLTFNANANPPTLVGRADRGVDTLFIYTATDTPQASASLTFRITVNGTPNFGDQMLAELTYARGQTIPPLTFPQAIPSAFAYKLSSIPTTAPTLEDFGLSFTSTSTVLGHLPPVVLEGAILESVSLGRSFYSVEAVDVLGGGSFFLFSVVIIEAGSLVFTGPFSDRFFTVDEPTEGLVLPDASGGTTPYTFTLDGAPAGLEFAADTRTLSGKPNTAGVFALTYTVRDANGMEMSRNFAVTVAAPPSFGAITIPTPVYALGDTIEPLTFPVASGGAGRIAYSATANGNTPLPLLLTFRLNTAPPTLVGEADSSVDVEFIYTATDRTGKSASLPFRITVTGQPNFGDQTLAGLIYARGQTIPPLTLPEASPSHLVDGYALTKLISTSPNLGQAGIVVTASTARNLQQAPIVLTGDILTNAPLGQYNYFLDARDFQGGQSSFLFGFRIVSAGSLVFTGSVPGQFFMADKAIADLVLPDASGGTAPYIFRLDGVPAGLAFNANTRTLSGTPTTEGVFALAYTVRDADGAEMRRNFAVTVSVPPTFGSATIADQSFAQMEGDENAITPLIFPEVSGGRGRIIYTLEAKYANARLPNAMRFNANTRPPTLTGTPNQGVDAEFSYTATDSIGASTSLLFQFTISGPPLFGDQTIAEQTYAQGQTIEPLTLPQATPADNVEHYTLLSSLLDALTALGLMVSSAGDDGSNNHQPPIVISGAVDADATTDRYTLEQQAVGTTASPGSSSFFFNIVAVPSGLQFIPPTIADQTYNMGETIADLVLPRALSGTSPYTFTLDGAPAGLDFTAATRTLSGTPTTAGASDVSYTLRDADDTELSLTFAITILDLDFNPATQADQIYTVDTRIADLMLPDAVNGATPYTFTLSGIPAGLDFTPDTRTLAGTPRTVGESSLTYTVRDADDTEMSLSFAITVNSGLDFGTETIPALSFEQFGFFTQEPIPTLTFPEATGGSGTIRYSLEDPNENTRLPDDMVFSANATPPTLSGMASHGVNAEFTYTATDTAGAKASLLFRLHVFGVGDFGEETLAEQTYMAGEAITPLALPMVISELADNFFVYEMEEEQSGSVTVLETALPGMEHTRNILSGTPRLADEGRHSIRMRATNTGDDSNFYFVVVILGELPPPTFDTAAETALGVASEGLTFIGGEAVALTLPAASGGVGSISYTLVDETDDDIEENYGLTFTAAERILAGRSISSDERFSLTYTATASELSSSLTFLITLQSPPPSFDPTEVEAQEYKIGVAVSLTLPEASNPVDDGIRFVHALEPNQEEKGLTYSATDRVLEGIPTAELATTQFTYTATEEDMIYGGGTGSLNFNITILPDLKFDPASVEDQTFSAGAAINPLTLPVASNGVPEYSYTLGGDLPADLEFDADTRVLSGTPAAAADATPLTFSVTDSDTVPAVRSLTFNLSVNAPVLTFTPDTVEDQSFTIGTDIEDLVLPVASGGVPEYAYTLGGAIPTGLSFAADTRTLSGAPDAVAAATPLTFTATDSDTVPATLSLIFNVGVKATLLGLTPATVADQSYAAETPIEPFTLPVAGGGMPEYTYTLGGAIPAGLSFVPATRILSGTPAAADTTPLTFTATDSATPTAEVAITFQVTVVSADVVMLTSGTVAEQSYAVGADISTLTLPTASGGTSPYSYTLDGDIPAGLIFNGAIDPPTLSGAPADSAVGEYSLTFRATDSAADSASASLVFTVIVNPAPLVFSPDAVAEQSYTVGRAIPTLNLPGADGGTSPYTFTLDGEPAGLRFNASASPPTLSGRPGNDAAGEYSLTYTVGDAAGVTTRLIFPVSVAPPPPLTLNPSTVAEQSYIVARSFATLTLPTAAGGITPYSYTLGGAIPAGLNFNASATPTTLSGAPAEGAEGDHNLTFTVSDDASVTTSIVFLVNIAPPPPLTFNPATVPEQSYTIDETIDTLNLPLAAGGIPGYAYTLTGAPAGLNFTPTSNPPTLIGTPAAGSQGDHQLVYTVSDSATVAVTTSLTFAVNVKLLPLVLIPDTVPAQTFIVGRDIPPLQLPVASGGAKPYNYALSDEPPGLNFNATSNPPTLSGKPTAEGEYQMTFSVTDSNLPSTSTTSLTFAVSVLSSTKENLIQVNEVLLPEIARAMADQHVDAVSRRISQARTARNTTGALGGQDSWAGLLHTHGLSLLDGKQLDSKELLRTSHFVLPLQSRSQLTHDEANSAAQISSLVVWGDGAYRKMSDEKNNVDWEGDISSVHLGLDALINEELMAGFAVTQSHSAMDYRLEDIEGIHEIDMTGLYPYFGWSSGRLDLWGTIGIGQGELEINDTTLIRPTSSDVSMWTLGFGGRAAIFNSPTIALHLRGDTLQSRLEVENSDDGFITASETAVSRMRFAMEATRSFEQPNGALFERVMDVGLRYDEGAGNNSAAFELGAALRHSEENFSIEGRIHTLVGRDRYSEWGAHATLQLVAPDGKGLSLQLSSNYGAEATPDVRQIWQRDLDLSEQQSPNNNNNDIAFKARLGYGIPTPTTRRHTLLTPYAEFTHGPTPQNTLGLLWQLQTATSLQLKWINQQDEAPKTQLEAKLRF